MIGPNALQRNVQVSGSEWLWNVQCPEKAAIPGSGTLAVQMFVRESQPDGGYRDVALNEVRLEVSLQPAPRSLPIAPLVAGLAIILTVALFAADVLRSFARRRT